MKQFKQQYQQQQKYQQNQFHAKAHRTGSNSSMRHTRIEQQLQQQQQEQYQQQPSRQWQQLLSDGPSVQHKPGEEPCGNGNIIANGNDKNGLNKIPMSEQVRPVTEGSSRGFHSVENPISAFANSRGALNRQINPCAESELASIITMNGTIVGVNMAENAV